MLTPEDIKNLTEFQKTIFVTQEGFDSGIEKLQKSFSDLQTTVDAMFKEKQTSEQDRTVTNHRIKNLENWVDKAAPKVNVKLQH